MYLFKDLLGQDSAVSFLRSAVQNDRLANAYLFYGPSGVGKKLAAISFAKAINCRSRDISSGAALDGCGQCPSCRKIDSLGHPDVRLTKAEKDGSSVKIGDIRSVIEDIGLKPYEATKKVYIVDGADELTEEAANALLKTLEEPSSESILILISVNPRRLLSTIRSRCQTVRFFPMNLNTVKDILTGAHGLKSDVAHILAGISCGSPGEALKLKSDDFFSRRERIIKALSSDSFSELDFDRAQKKELQAVLSIILLWYRDILITKTGNSNIVNIDKETEICREAKRVGFNKLNNTLNRVMSTQLYLEQNANPRLAMAALGSSI